MSKGQPQVSGRVREAADGLRTRSSEQRAKQLREVQRRVALAAAALQRKAKS